MLPIRLEIKNFLAYRAPDPVRFDGIHLACLTGNNGAGKSSLLDAITWVLWGKARARRDEELVHLGQHDMYVQLDFEQEGTIYRVLRQRTRKSGGAGTLELFSIGDDGQLIPLTEPNMRATQARINRLLRLDHETFAHSAFLQQGRADAFTVKTPKERKQILSDILGLARWEDYEEAAKETLKQIDSDIQVYESRLQDIDLELQKEPQLQTELGHAEASQNEAQAALEIAEKSLAEVAHAESDLRAARERLAEIDGRIKERQAELKNTQAEIGRQHERIASYEAVVARRGDIEAGYNALQAAREADHALGDLLIQMSDLETQQHRLERELDAARAELTNELSACEAEIAAFERTIEMAQAEDLVDVQSEIASLHALDTQREELQAVIGQLEQERSGLVATNTHLREEMDTMKDRLEKLAVVSGATCPLCGQPLDEAHREELMTQVQAEGKQRGDTYRSNMARTKEIDALLTRNRTDIGKLVEDLKNLQPMIERAGVLQAGVDAASNAQAHLQAAQARAETLRAQLAQDDFAADVRQQLADLLARRESIGYDSDRHSAARQDLDTYREFEAQQTALNLALSALPDVQAALEGAQLRQERLDKAIAEEQTKRESVTVDIAGLEVLAKEQLAREEEVRKQRALERSAYQRLVNAQQELAALASQRERKLDLEARCQQRREDRALYDELREAFGKKGIPAMIIETAIPELETAANRLLARMTDGRMQLKMETQREKVTGGVIETLDIHIADELGTRSYETYSGGEAFRINFAIRVALSQLLARRAGAHLRTLFIDEGFGTQDEDGRNKLVEAITAIQGDFDMILVVTHIDDLRDSFPVHLVVTKTNDGSYVSVR
ncbi:MAG: SMC family ATPase [Anaerolineae bacterium]|nr:SMC family ATPase [Anaerolineae bacterium]